MATEKEGRFEINAVLSAPKVLFFDVNESLLDLGELKLSVANSLGGREGLVSLWFTMMLQYSLVTTTAGKYANFGAIGAATLQMLASNYGIELSKEAANLAIKPLLSLTPHPEVKKALELLKSTGYRMISLTNSSKKGVATQFNNAGLTNFFEQQLSIEDVGKYKPDRQVYQWAAKKAGVAPAECLMIAAHGWDIVGALWAGWRAAFIARPGQQLYPLAPFPEIIEADLLRIAEKLAALGD